LKITYLSHLLSVIYTFSAFLLAINFYKRETQAEAFSLGLSPIEQKKEEKKSKSGKNRLAGKMSGLEGNTEREERGRV
jgi:hypothetical protein